MSTKHLLLGLLEIEPSSGYDLAFRSVASLGPLWSATHSQIYTTLHGMLRDGFVTSEADPSAGQRNRTVYTLTDAGREELARWREAPIQYLPSRNTVFLWAQSSLDNIPLDVALRRLDEHAHRARQTRDECLGIAEEVRDGRNTVLERRSGWMSEAELRRVRIAKAAVYDELAAEAEFELESIERLRAVARQLAEEPVGAEASR